MGVLGYYLALNFLHALGGRSPIIDDVSVKMADLNTLSTYLKSYPQFDIESFKKDRVNLIGDVGLYLSDNLRLYCLNGEGNPQDDGFLVMFTFKEKGSGDEGQTETNLAHHSFFFRKDGLPEELVLPVLAELNKQHRSHNSLIVITDPREETVK